jgi:hypothetical protein
VLIPCSESRNADEIVGVSARIRCTPARLRDDPSGGEVGRALVHLVDGAPLGLPDLTVLLDHLVEQGRVVGATVEDQAQRVVPATPRRQPVGEQERSGRDGQPELLLDLPGDSHLRGLTDLDHAPGQVPVLFVGEAAQEHAAVAVADQHLADRTFAGEEGVEQSAEAARFVDRGVGRQPGVDDAVALDAAHHALTAHARPRGDPLGVVVVGGHQRLHAGVPLESRSHLTAYDVDGRHPPGGREL